MEKTDTAEYKNILHFFVAFIATAFVFAIALSTIITVLFFGLNIVTNGLQTCNVLIQQNQFEIFLYTSCGCALVEIILSLLSIVALKYVTPRLLKQYAYWRVLVQSRFQK